MRLERKKGRYHSRGRFECACPDVKQRFDADPGREHDGQTTVVLVARLCGHPRDHFFLQHEMHVLDGVQLIEEMKQQRS